MSGYVPWAVTKARKAARDLERGRIIKPVTSTGTIVPERTTDRRSQIRDRETPQMAKLTLNMLREFGSCGSYLRTFGDLFPQSDERYTHGVEVTREVCVANASNFDWAWAAEVMLTTKAQREYYTIRDSNDRDYRHYGRGDERRAAIFGQLMEDPENIGDKFRHAAASAAERADVQAIAQLEAAKMDVTEAERQAQYWAEKLPEYQARLTAATTAATEAQVRQAARATKSAQELVDTLQARLTSAQDAAAEAEQAESKLLEDRQVAEDAATEITDEVATSDEAPIESSESSDAPAVS